MVLTERPMDEQESGGAVALESPFLETSPAQASFGGRGFSEASEALSPFAGDPANETQLAEADRLVADAFAELRDETFDEAVAFLAEETEQAVADRFTDEAPTHSAERERFAESYLSGVGFEAEQYLNALEAGLSGLDISSLTEEQLEDKLDQFEPETSALSPAGEEFVGGLVRKAKKAIKFVANAASSVGKFAGSVLSSVLKRLKALIRPLLRRVLSFAIGRLPAPLQSAARALASKIQFEEEDRFEPEDEDRETEMSPANLADPETLAEEFDAALAEAFMPGAVGEVGLEGEEFQDEVGAQEGTQLERLAEARGKLIDALRAGDPPAVGPAIEQFVPALLGALRLGINLVGRSKVVGFLARYLSKLIGRWVGPKLSGPLSNAIVDMGLRLIMLETEDEGDASRSQAGPIALASVIEDTVRRLAEEEDYIFEDEDLTQLAAAEAFSQAVSTHFPPQFVRPDLRQSATLGGTFVTKRPLSLRSYHKYSRAPEIEITPQIANTLPGFGGTTLGRTLRAAGVPLPMKARMHIYQSAPGTTLPAIARTDRGLSGAGRGYAPATSFLPLTPAAAGLLLREPHLGVTVPSSFLRSPNRIAVGQRFYVLQPLGGGTPSGVGGTITRSARAAFARLAPGKSRITVNRRRGRVTIRLFFSEAESQRLASQIRGGAGHGALLQALIRAYRSIASRNGGIPVLREEEQVFEELLPNSDRRVGFLRAALGRRLRGWIIPALAKWTRANADAFARAAAHPANGVTVKIRVSGLPGLRAPSGSSRTAMGTPSIAVAVLPGSR